MNERYLLRISLFRNLFDLVTWEPRSLVVNDGYPMCSQLSPWTMGTLCAANFHQTLHVHLILAIHFQPRLPSTKAKENISLSRSPIQLEAFSGSRKRMHRTANTMRSRNRMHKDDVIRVFEPPQPPSRRCGKRKYYAEPAQVEVTVR